MMRDHTTHSTNHGSVYFRSLIMKRRSLCLEGNMAYHSYSRICFISLKFPKSHKQQTFPYGQAAGKPMFQPFAWFYHSIKWCNSTLWWWSTTQISTRTLWVSNLARHIHTNKWLQCLNKCIMCIWYENKVCLVGLYSFSSADSHFSSLQCSGTFRMVFIVWYIVTRPQYAWKWSVYDKT